VIEAYVAARAPDRLEAGLVVVRHATF